MKAEIEFLTAVKEENEGKMQQLESKLRESCEAKQPGVTAGGRLRGASMGGSTASMGGTLNNC